LSLLRGIYGRSYKQTELLKPPGRELRKSHMDITIASTANISHPNYPEMAGGGYQCQATPLGDNCRS